MRIRVVFGQTTVEPELTLGPFSSFRIEGGVMREARGTAPFAHMANDLWTVKGSGYLRVDCAGPLVIQTEGGPIAQRGFGPFGHFSFVGITAFADREVFARYNDASRLWYFVPSHEHCYALVVTETEP
jgi:hypothetical protein